MFVYGDNATTDFELVNQQQLKSYHLRQLFDLVLENKRVSRTWLAHYMKLSTTAVSSLVDELLENEVLISVGQGISKTAGRKPIMLEVNRKWRQIVTFRLDLYEIEYALYDMVCQPLETIKKRIKGNDYVAEMRSILRQSQMLKRENVISVCVAVPAIADCGSQRLLLNILEIENEQKFLKDMAELFPEAVLLVGNDSVAYSYAEKEFASEEGIQNLIYINYTHGIGAGIIIDGKIFNDTKHNTGEIGHMSIDMNGPQCICGNRGCLERMISIPAVIRETKHKLEEGSYSIITDLCGNDLSRLDIEMIIYAFLHDDMTVSQIIKDMAFKLSFGIRNVFSMFHPQEVVIGGIAHRFGERFLEMLIQYTKGSSYWEALYETKIRYTQIKEFGANLGIAKYYLDSVMSLDRNETVQKCTMTLF
ncbi:ROK family protein [Christensenella tenuis]|uniref:ROK family protein n=1 Tax=Christensenella tenuis TaxID=2763033 RepID=A0ABR7EBM7_9FIRM|nr:ROK family protein [Christensenella tenuis]MBC5647170.1 ROK family protein [Christensenella tenuis]